MAVRVIKSSGHREEFSEDKLKSSLAKAARDVGVEVDGEVSITPKGDVYSYELSDIAELELLRRAIDDPKYAAVATSHLLGRVYKEALGKDFLKHKSGYGERAVAKFEQLASEGLIKGEALSLLRAFEPRPDFDRSLSYNALRLFTNGNYALRGGDFRLAETPSMAAWRVATAVARDTEMARRYYGAITSLKIVPASPFWFNAWTKKEMFASCFTLEVEDCLSSLSHPNRFCIYDALAYSGIIQQLGGGVGYDFSLLRPEGDVVRGSVGVASGPISFMKLFDTNVEVIKQGGKRRGAQMGTLHVWHPDVRKFIKAKTGELKDAHLQNFNISVFADDSFMEKALGLDKDPRYPLVNPRIYLEKTGRKPVEELRLSPPQEAVAGWADARELFREIAEGAWDSGDPGVIYKDNLNASNPLLGVEVEVAGYKFRYVWRSVNPCAETVQNPFEVCNLTHINLAKFARECTGKTLEEKLACIDWDGLAEAARLGTRFLDEAIDRSRTGIGIIDEMNRATRKNGLGIMGFAELLIKLGIPYASWEAVELINRIMAWIYVNALDESAELARERGPFKFFEESAYARGEIPVLKFQDYVWGKWERVRGAFPPELREAGDRLREITMRTREWLGPRLEALREKVKGGVRNSVVLSIAPTGRTSILAGTTSGVEPVFALAFIRNVTVGTLIEYYWPAVEWLRARGLWTPQVRKTVEETGMLKDAPLPEEVKHLFATAMEIGWLWHVLMQASAQQWVDQGISKTINMPANAPKEDVYWAFALAWALGVKGITVYRDKSKSVQVIYTGLKQEIKKKLADTKIIVKPVALEASIEEAAEQAKLKALEEGKDPYCKTGECG
ncbi:adenosylcobalamin-dependent ribonucleoside-diphosphate reductase [Thermoproteus tenax]|uniref:Vitamin B12-dependent ribonucleotide reductase n=1 Tax=Thermoproteus tenax (strain ATCC 35583 / DSM 2078 / JCM 9277 / NBRC 100435 / Kra 1) TaxID=768679 RepID=G4RL15_THETK|nr:adenosylcobalamin-dependent ribonucleoside-diphosphate reductase [Thermoproteus tenax]CCC82260.1 ribonucleoside-diphosphate reductase alpha chain [Thermoproteus tenax Kra 1]